MFNLELKVSILRSGKMSYQIASELEWHPTKISQIISGVYLPDEEEKMRLANAVGVPVSQIFQANDPVGEPK